MKITKYSVKKMRSVYEFYIYILGQCKDIAINK